MNERQIREKLLFRYSGALERGDFETLAAVLAEAEHDPILEAMILEVNEVYGAELPAPRPKETLPMTTVMTLQRPSVLRYAMPLAAAAALVLIVGLLALTGRDTRLAPQPGDDNSAALLQSSTATPTPAPMILPATATPIPVVADPIIPERIGTSVCIAVKPEIVAAVRSRPTLDATPISQVDSRTPLSVMRLLVNGVEPAAPVSELAGSGALDTWMAQGIDSPLWFFGWAQVDDAVIQGWVLGDQGIEVIQCRESLAVPTVPPPGFVPTIVPTATPLAVIEPAALTATHSISQATQTAESVFGIPMTATAIINEAADLASGGDGIPMTATAIIIEATARVGDAVLLVPTVVPPAAVEAEIAVLSATIEALRAQIGMPAPMCTVFVPSAMIIYSLPATDAHPLQHDPIPAWTELRVTGLVSGVSDGLRWYQVDADFDGGSIRGGYVRADQVREVTPCPGL